MKVGNEIKVIRELLKLTQTELANELNVTYEAVNRWENEKTEIEGYNLEKLYNFAYNKNGLKKLKKQQLLHFFFIFYSYIL